jgi:hypothetical protein
MVIGVGLGVLLACLAGIGTWLFAPHPKHVVRTLINVPTDRGGQILQVRSEGVTDQGSHQRNQMAMARSRVVLDSALRDPKVANLPTVVNMLDPVEWLEKEVLTDFSVAPEILKISMRGMETAELVVLVNAIREAYIREIIGTREAQRIARQNMLEGLIRNYEQQLKSAREAQKDDAEKLGGGNTDVRARQLAHLNTSLAQTERELLGAKSQLTKARLHVRDLEEELKNHDKDQVPEYALTEALNQSKAVAALKAELASAEARLDSTVKTSAPGEQEAAVQRLRGQVKKLQADILRASEAERPRLAKELKEQRRQQILAELAQEKGRVGSLTAASAHYEQDFKRLCELLQKQGKIGAKSDRFQGEITHLEEIVKKLRIEQEAIQIELQAPPRHKVIEEATAHRDPR